jgi:hypothetical protein
MKYMGVGVFASLASAQPIIVEVRLAGQPVAVTVNGQQQVDPAFNASTPIEFDLPPTFSGALSVRIYDSTPGADGQPDQDIGSIKINGGQPGTTSRMDLFVSGEAAFPLLPRTNIETRGVRSFGTPTSAGLSITNPDLRRRVARVVNLPTNHGHSSVVNFGAGGTS